MQTGHIFCRLTPGALLSLSADRHLQPLEPTAGAMSAVFALAADSGEAGRGAVDASAQPTGFPRKQALGGADHPPVFSAAEHGSASDSHSSGELG